MTIIKNFTLLIFMVVFLDGCAVTNIQEDYLLDENKGTGLLIISLTRSGISESSMFADIRGVDNKYDDSIPVTDLFASSDWGCPLFGDIPENQTCGRLAIVELPKGEYEFYAWHGNSGSTSVWSVKKFSKRFIITPGKAVYAGNINFLLKKEYTGETMFGIKVPTPTFYVTTSDTRERDLSLFYKKNPKITSDDVQIHIIK